MIAFMKRLLPQARRMTLSACPDAAALTDLAYSADVSSPSGSRETQQTLQHLLTCEACALEWNQITKDRAAALDVSVPSAPVLTADKRRVRFLSGWASVLMPAFRSDAVAPVVDSRIVPCGRDYVILEVRGEDEGVAVRLHRGEKNGKGPRISLYRDGQAVEVFHLQKTRQWQIGSFLPGHYSLLMGKKNILAFRIIE